MPDFGFRHSQLADFSEQQSALLGYEQEYNQLGTGVFDGTVETLTIGQVLVREKFNVSVERLGRFSASNRRQFGRLPSEDQQSAPIGRPCHDHAYRSYRKLREVAGEVP